MIEILSRKHKHKVGPCWRIDETYIKVKGIWKYLYPAVDKEGTTVDFLLTANRDMAGSRRFFEKVIRENATSDKIAMDKSGAKEATIDEINGGIAVQSPYAKSNTSTTLSNRIIRDQACDQTNVGL